MTTHQGDEYETLLQFLYQAPIGLVQTTRTGDITMMNPMSAQLLMPLAPQGDLDNLFDILHDLAPQQAAILMTLGGQTGRGYLFSRPPAAADASRWLLELAGRLQKGSA